MAAATERAFACMGVRDVRSGLAAGAFSAREIAEASLARVRALDLSLIHISEPTRH